MLFGERFGSLRTHDNIEQPTMSQVLTVSTHDQMDRSIHNMPLSESTSERIMRKAYRLLVRLMFTNRHEHAKKYDKSATNPLLQFMNIAGVSWLAARNLPKWSISLIAFYHLFVFLIQAIYLSVLMIDFYISKIGNYQWVTTPFYLYGILLIMSMWLNIRLHLLRSNTIAEAACSYSINSKFVKIKNRRLKCICFLFICLVFLFAAFFGWSYNLSNDLFGIRSAKPSGNIFSCGLFCDISFYYITFMIIVTSICATGVFTMLTVSILMEAKQLNVDIRRYPSNDGLDNLIFRYQSINRCANAVNEIFSCFILGLVFLTTVGGTIVLLKHYTQLMVEHWETGASLLLFFYVLGCLILLVFLLLGVALNERLVEFREASQRISDFQQLDTTNQNSIKLLSFMLRLSGAKEQLKMGGICAVNRQTLFTMFLILSIVGFMLYSVNTGCVKIF